jgi:sugar phosphate isomerase/epimerase
MIADLDRRSLLAGIGATAMTAMTAATAGAAFAAPRRRRFFERVGKPIGLQFYTLGDEPKADLDATFARVAQIGYRDIELSQLYGRTPAQVKAAADRAGLTVSCIYLSVSTQPGTQPGSLSLDSAPQRIADELGALGVRAAVLPIAPFPPGMKPRAGESFLTMIPRAFAEAGADHWKRTAAMFNEKAAQLKTIGIDFGYHNHNLEFAPNGNTTGWDILLHETDPALVHFEVDLGWVATAGRDPVAFLRGVHGRVRWLHVKDLKAETVPNFALSTVSTEVGAGKQDWARILPAALAAGAQHFYVEQEPPFATPRIDAAAKSYAFLAQLRA